MLYGTYFGPTYFGTLITQLAVSSDGSLYFSGFTNATTFQATPGAFLTTPSPGFGFIAKLTPGSSVLESFDPQQKPSVLAKYMKDQPALHGYCYDQKRAERRHQGITSAHLKYS